jgi:hypothetical protein
MQDFSSWTLERIRDEGSSMNWMEERKFDWVPLAASAIDRLINAQTFLLITDRKREWFARYILSRLNRYDGDRPLLPIVSLGTVFPYIDQLKDDEQMSVLEDMLSLSFPAGYTFFYIGTGKDQRSQIAKRKDNSFIWLLDENVQNSFYLDSKDENLDIKLIQLITLFDKSIDATLFSEVDLESAL